MCKEMSEIAAQFKEFNELDTEIIRRSKELKTLRDRRKELEEKLKKFLTETHRPGVKIPQSEKAIVIETKKGHGTLSKNDRKRAVETVLAHYGIENGTKLIQELDAARKGPETEVSRIKTINVGGGVATVPRR